MVSGWNWTFSGPPITKSIIKIFFNLTKEKYQRELGSNLIRYKLKYKKLVVRAGLDPGRWVRDKLSGDGLTNWAVSSLHHCLKYAQGQSEGLVRQLGMPHTECFTK